MAPSMGFWANYLLYQGPWIGRGWTLSKVTKYESIILRVTIIFCIITRECGNIFSVLLSNERLQDVRKTLVRHVLTVIEVFRSNVKPLFVSFLFFPCSLVVSSSPRPGSHSSPIWLGSCGNTHRGETVAFYGGKTLELQKKNKK